MSNPGKNIYIAAALYIGRGTLLESSGHCQKQALLMSAYFGLPVPHSWGFVTLPYTYLYHQIWLNPLTKKHPPLKKNTGFETPRAFFLFVYNPFSFFESAHFTCLSVSVCLLHCFLAVAPYCSPTSSCARSSERKKERTERKKDSGNSRM
jgi:hypothetical protein